MWTDLFQLIFPKCCLACDSILLEQEQVLCMRCREELPYTYQHLYRSNEAHSKFYGRIIVEQAACLLYFSKKGRIQRLFHNLKYNNHPEISFFLGHFYAEQLMGTPFHTQTDVIIPVPLHRKKQKKRGYNQVEGFARALAETFSKPIDYTLLYKTTHTDSQTRKNIFDRSLLTQNAFEISQTHHYNGTHFLLIDDILTTGATLEACGKKLLQIPNCKLSILCLAMTH